jgi:hypothetical protein
MFRHTYRTRVFAMSLLVLPGFGLVHAGTASAANPAYNTQSHIPNQEGTSSGEGQNGRPMQGSTSRDSQGHKMTQETTPSGGDAMGARGGERHSQHHAQSQDDHSMAKQGAETAKKGDGAAGSGTRY